MPQAAPPTTATDDRGPPPRFVTGSITRHIIVMTATGAVGLMAIFVSDFANIFFLGLQGDPLLLAAVGYASTVLFFLFSGSIGLSIAITALVAPALGARDVERARRIAAHAALFVAAASTLVVAVLWPLLPALLAGLGAAGRAHALAHAYLAIVLPSLPPLALAMGASGVLRAAGDAQRAMYVTLTGAVVGTILDAVLIVWLGLGIHGAGIAAAIAHLAMLAVGWRGIVRVHGLLARPDWNLLEHDARLIGRFALPSVLTNLATPAGGAYVTVVMARFGDGAVAGWAVIGRIIPIAFGAIFALSAAIAPIIGQNLGARKLDRVRATLRGGLVCAAVITAVAWACIAVAAPGMVAIFKVSGEAADLILLFCRGLAPLFVFFGTLFVCNAACNALGRPHYATALNWGRATLGTVPFVTLGAHWGSAGVLVGHMLGGIAFGLAAVAVVHRLIAHMQRDLAPAGGS